MNTHTKVQLMILDQDTCHYNGNEFDVGRIFPANDTCNSCICHRQGRVECTERHCEPVEMPCFVDGLWHHEGNTFPASDGCNTCTCGQGGVLSCTEKYCTTPKPDIEYKCQYGVKLLREGESFIAKNVQLCSNCTCQVDGRITCIEVPCPQKCVKDGFDYYPGDVVKSVDKCNECMCSMFGEWDCTEKACVTDLPNSTVKDTSSSIPLSPTTGIVLTCLMVTILENF